MKTKFKYLTQEKRILIGGTVQPTFTTLLNNLFTTTKFFPPCNLHSFTLPTTPPLSNKRRLRKFFKSATLYNKHA